MFINAPNSLFQNYNTHEILKKSGETCFQEVALYTVSVC